MSLVPTIPKPDRRLLAFTTRFGKAADRDTVVPQGYDDGGRHPSLLRTRRGPRVQVRADAETSLLCTLA